MTYTTQPEPATDKTELCVQCNAKPRWSRGLCGGCYSAANRGGFLDDYPTDKFRANPEAHVRWAFLTDPELIADVAIEFGYTLTKR